MEEQIQHTDTQKTNKVKPILLTLLALVLVAAAGGGSYYWQHQKLETANADLATTKSQNTKLNADLSNEKKQVTTLQNQYNQAKATIDGYQASVSASHAKVATQADLTLKVNGAQYVNPAGTVTQGGKWFGVNITLTNNTSDTVSVSDSNFYLKDSQGNQYPELTIQGASTLPTGWVSLPNTTVAPGQTLTGTVTFQMTTDTIKSFNFINVTNSYPVTSSS